MKKLYLDSNVLIYLAQPASEFYKFAWETLDIAEKRGFLLLTSSLGYAEYGVLQSRDGLRAMIEKLFDRGDIIELPFGHEEAIAYPKFRIGQGGKIGAIDAMHLATAAVNGADYLITNDTPLSKLKTPDLKCVYLPAAAEFLRKL